MTISEIQEEVVEEFGLFEDWMEKYEQIIEAGRDLAPLGPEFHTDDYLVKGCQSQVWLHAAMDEGKLIFSADSDAIITKGLVALMIRVLSGHTPQEVHEADLGFIDRIGLKEHLSPTRSNGLLSMVKKMKIYALAFQAKTEH